MTREQTYQAVVDRIQKPENKERREQEFAATGKLGIRWHLERAKKMLEMLSTNPTQCKKGLYENDFDVSIKEIQKMMDEQGWK